MKISHCRLLRKVQLKLLEFFVLEVTARSAANILGIQPNSAALFYRKIREVIAYHLEQESHKIFDGIVELDESYFGGVRKGKSETLMPLITRKISPDSVVYTDCYRSYNTLDVSHFYHERINHSTLFTQGKNHINGIENFWNQAKRVLRKYNGIPKESFPLFLKESEFRFNYGTPKHQLKILKNWTQI